VSFYVCDIIFIIPIIYKLSHGRFEFSPPFFKEGCLTTVGGVVFWHRITPLVEIYSLQSGIIGFRMRFIHTKKLTPNPSPHERGAFKFFFFKVLLMWRRI
jgi:hypothetical protein